MPLFLGGNARQGDKGTNGATSICSCLALVHIAFVPEVETAPPLPVITSSTSLRLTYPIYVFRPGDDSQAVEGVVRSGAS